MVKKVLCAMKGVLPAEFVPGIEVYLKQRNTILAVHAFEAMQGHWRPRHLPLLKDLYPRVLSVSIKRDIMAVIAAMDTVESRDYLRSLSGEKGISGEYAQFCASLNDPVSLQDKRVTQDNLYMALRRLKHLKEAGNIQFIDLLMDHIIQFSAHRDRFMDRIAGPLRKNNGK